MIRMWTGLWTLALQELFAHGQNELIESNCDVQGMLQLKLQPDIVKPETTTTEPAEASAANLSNSSQPPLVTLMPTQALPAPVVNITTFHWEPHWQCAETDSACIAAALSKLKELVSESGAQIVGALELKGASGALPGWSSSKEYEDAVSVMVAPGWQVLKEGGGHICCDGQRGLAVMLVKPPFQVSNCDTLCVMAVHPGHSPIQSGESIVKSVCGDATTSCAIAVGDWNVDAAGVVGGSFNTWQRLVGGNPPSFVVPDSETCCYPSTCCKFDHVVTNIPGAEPLQVHVWPYQLLGQFGMDEEHMPVAVRFSAPAKTTLIG